MYQKLVIDQQLKLKICDKLDQANINERVLFPGLDGLSQWLRRQYAQVDCHQPIDDYQNRFTRH
ncbi:hypothetical protein [Spirosoma sp.]|uniref:hypothetical protein n=1 Tax=Spirosoma sp. TaxID=1899569 RepID=UPI00262F18ED|nr:hypothetical protein [Spirosoma sp.]MCX6219112.1 hypothetical protein [Spirosoma sp.]